MSIKKWEPPHEMSKPMTTQLIRRDASDTVLGIRLLRLDRQVA